MKQIIWSSDLYDDEQAQAEFEEEQAENCAFFGRHFRPSYNRWCEEVQDRLDFIRAFNDYDIDGVIIAFASLGLWNGRKNGYKIYGPDPETIFYSSCDSSEWYFDEEDIRATFKHHDGVNYVLYRIVDDKKTAETIAEQIYYNQIDETQFIKLTKSLKPYIKL